MKISKNSKVLLVNLILLFFATNLLAESEQCQYPSTVLAKLHGENYLLQGQFYLRQEDNGFFPSCLDAQFSDQGSSLDIQSPRFRFHNGPWKHNVQIGLRDGDMKKGLDFICQHLGYKRAGEELRLVNLKSRTAAYFTDSSNEEFREYRERDASQNDFAIGHFRCIR